MSSAPPILISGGTAKPCGPTRPRLLILARPATEMAWWLDPVRAILLIVMPLFCFAAYQNQFNFWQFKASADFITGRTFGIGMYSAGLMITGIVFARLALPARDMVTVFDEDRSARVLMRIGWITIAAYAVLLGTLLLHIGLVLSFLRGDISAGSELRNVLGRVPGVTSLVQFGLTYLAILSALVTLTSFRLTPRLRAMAIAILILIFLRSILASERLALLEALAAIFIVPIAFRWRPSLLRNASPFVAAMFVFVAFAFSEYFRSWQYYKNFYDSYLVFVSERFAGYFSTSINNGAGAYLYYGSSAPVAQITTGWVAKLPILKGFFVTDGSTAFDDFLQKYSTPEFNNPGGFYAAFLDYNFLVASMFMIVIGLAIGVAYRKFCDGHLVGLALYPLIFLGLTDLIRILYITDTRTLPILIGAIVAWYGIRPATMPRSRLPLPSAAPTPPVFP